MPATLSRSSFGALLLGTTLFCASAAAAHAQSADASGWDAYCRHDLPTALARFEAQLARDPHDVDAFYGWTLLADATAGAPTGLDIAERLLALPQPHEALLDAYSQVILPTAATRRDRKRVEQLYERAMADPKLSAESQAILRGFYRTYRYIAGEREEMATWQDEEHGSLSAWAFVGPFDNDLGSGFDNDHGPLRGATARDSFLNDARVAVTWQPVLNYSGDRLTLNEYSFTDGKVNYLQTFVTVPADGTYRLNFSYGGSVKVWLDDALAFAESEERHTDARHDWIEVPLAAGPHRILVQVGAAERGDAYFMASLADGDGRDLPALPASATAVAYAPLDEIAVTHGRAAGFEAGARAAQAEGASEVVRVVHIAQLLKHGYYREARRLFNELSEAARYSPVGADLAAKLLLAEGDETGLAEVRGRLTERSPTSTLVVVGEVQEAIDRKDLEAMRAGLQQLEANEAPPLAVELFRITVKFMENDVRGGMSDLERLRREYPARVNVKDIELNAKRSMYNDVDRLIRIQEAFVEDNYADAERVQLAQLYAEANRRRKAVAAYRDVLRFDPSKLGHRIAIAELLHASGDTEGALAEVDLVLAQAPYVAQFHQLRADYLTHLDRRADAIDAYAYALTLNRNDYDLRRTLRTLRGEPDPFAALDSLEATRAISERGGRFDDTDHPIAQIMHEVRRVVYADGASEIRTGVVYKVLNDRGRELLKEYNLTGAEVHKAEIIRADGRRVDGEQAYGKLVFPKLTPGDYVHIEYAQTERNTGRFLGHFWGEWELDAWYPIAETRYQVLAPADFALRTVVIGAEVAPEERTVGDRIVRTWRVADPPLRPDETLGPNTADVGIRLHTSTVPDWDFVRAWYRDLSTSRTRADYAVEAELERLFPEGVDAVAEGERIRRIYDFVSGTIEYSSLPFRQSAFVPQRPGKTLNDQLGDCKDVSTLFVALARGAGVAADLVLVDTRDNGAHHGVLPGMEFNHCIVRLPGEGTYLELTDKHLPLGATSNGLAGSLALAITDSAGAGLVRIPAGRSANGVAVATRAELDGDDLRVAREAAFFGVGARNLRAAYVDQDDADRRDRRRQRIARRVERPFVLEELTFGELNARSDTSRLSERIAISGAASALRDMRVLTLPWTFSHTGLDFLGDDERETALALWRYTDYDVNTERLELRLPPGAEGVDVPADVRYESDGLFYALTFVREGDRLVAERTCRIARDTFAPEEYADVKAWFYRVAEADGQLISL